MRVGRRMLAATLVSLVILGALIWAVGGSTGFVFALLGWMFAFQAYIAIESIRMMRRIRRMAESAGPNARPNETVFRRAIVTGPSVIADGYSGVKTVFLGLPLIDINVSDPGESCGTPLPIMEILRSQ